jgi:hypothetical protein
MTDRSPLDRLSIASPCSADWNQMQGDERRRFCSSCSLHVHDLSRMTTDEAMSLLQQAGQGRVCVRFFRRSDGKVLTRDCPVGLRQKLRRMAARAAALWLLLCSGLAACVRPRQAEGAPAQPQPVSAPQPGPEAMPLQGEAVMGDIELPEPTPVVDSPQVLQGRIRIDPR